MPKPIPDGYHSVTPAVIVKDAKKALEFYKKAFDAKELSVIPTPEGRVMHAEFKIGDSILMLGEENPAWPDHKSAETLKGSPVSLNIYLADADAAYKKAVAAGARSVKAPEDAFWGDRYGEVRDPFGITWALLTRKREVSHEEMKKAALEMFTATAGKR
ncbi:MAG: VOC family protein [Elusimicrobia bacterium]|nr:VOC family protein [Elusimicrobiota bacterium]